ncbi:hypothetical protein [Streptomyces heilongjiangensis]|uniref:Uncharacterized protein n=1 Tax=Streptomyces heilongjiangensis TaxID=945052 RepID=A0ABW1B1B3_9ACTN|nr:hypothetical protein [Streptomyces heilongjiangensis]MDC2948064.1 hypothetical protein [Streptomyces heilongjiangensis]
MSRTVHHVRSRHRKVPAYWAAGLPAPWTAHTLTGLRYSGGELSRARREGRRPRPTRVVRAFTSYRYARAVNEHFWDPYESQARAALRAFRTAARTHLRAAPPGGLLTAADLLDHPPTRHRHRNLGEA